MNFKKEEYKLRLKKVQNLMQKKGIELINLSRYGKHELSNRL